MGNVYTVILYPNGELSYDALNIKETEDGIDYIVLYICTLRIRTRATQI